MNDHPILLVPEAKASRLRPFFNDVIQASNKLSNRATEAWGRTLGRRLNSDDGSWNDHTADRRSFPRRLLVAWAKLTVSAVCMLPNQAFAHVKWFAPTDVAQDPLVPTAIFNPLFWSTAAFACVVLFLASVLEQTSLGRRVAASVDAAIARFGPVEPILRVATGSFFLSLWAHGGILLTPELPTDANIVAWLQFAIGVCMLTRRLLPLGALGIFALYFQAVQQHGVFHMLDYIFFPGLACYLALSGSTRETLLSARMPVLRISLALSLMWVGIEKFVYPHWTMYVMEQHPIITFGFDPYTMTQLAGIVEFSLAFSLLWTPLVRRGAALVLAALMSVAILEFGKVDAIGHIVPIGVLIAIVIDRSHGPAFSSAPSSGLRPTHSPILLGSALGMVFTSYYVAHAIL